MAVISEIKTRYGDLQVPNAERDIVGRHLGRFGEWAWLEVLFIASLLPIGGARVLDGGAFLGTFGLGLARAVKLDYIHFVEANSDIIPLLVNNIHLNCQAKFCVENVLLAPRDSKVGVPHADQDNLGSMSFVLVDNGDQLKDTVERQTLHQIERRVGEFDLVKLDVEGAELPLLEADLEYLRSRNMMLWIECNETPQSFALVQLLLSMGRSVYYYAFPAYNPDNINNSKDPIFPWAYEAGLLATHKEISGLNEDLIAYGCILKKIENISDLKVALWHTPRWGLDEWLNLSLPEVVALAAHRLHGDDINNFPEENPKPRLLIGDQLRGVQQELRDVQQELATATVRIRTMAENFSELKRIEENYKNMLVSANERISELENNVALSAAQALERLAQVGAVKRRADEQIAAVNESIRIVIETQGAEKLRLGQEITLLRSQLDALRAIEGSTYWRMGAPIRRLAVKHPSVKYALTLVRRVLAKITRPFR